MAASTAAGVTCSWSTTDRKPARSASLGGDRSRPGQLRLRLSRPWRAQGRSSILEEL